jgi:phage gp29-like protein
MKFWVTFTEKYGMPYMIGKYARGTDSKEIDALLLSLDNMIQDAVAAIPDDSSVSILEAGGKGATADIYEKLLHFCNAEISKAIVGQTLTTEMGSSGSFAASKTHKEVLQDVIDSDARMIESAMNELIGWIVTLNFADADAPKFVMFEKEDVDKTLAERDTQLVNGGVRFTKKYYTRAYGFKDDEIEVTDPQAATKMSEFRFSESKPIDTLDAKSREVDTTSIEDEILNALDSALASSESYEEAFETLLEDFPQLSLDRLQEAITHLGANATILGGGEVADEQR